MSTVKDRTEVEIVKEIFDASSRHDILSRELGKYKEELFKWNARFHIEGSTSEYVPPQLQQIQRVYPKPQSQLKINWIRALIPIIVSIVLLNVGSFMFQAFSHSMEIIGGLFMIVGVLIFIPALVYIVYYAFIRQRKIKAEDEMRIQNSAEYQNIKANLDRQYDEQDAKLKEKYNQELKEYNEKKATRVNELTENIKKAESDLKEVKDRLDNLYVSYGKIPVDYRNSEALEYIYQQMSSSDAGINAAINSYELKLKREEEQRRIREEEEQRRREEQLQREYEEQLEYERMREEQRAQSAGGSFLRDVAATAIGASIANHGIKKELRKSREAEEARERDRLRREQAEATRRKDEERERQSRENVERSRREAKERQEQWLRERRERDERTAQKNREERERYERERLRGRR